jgi:hypothetical protein
MQSIKFPSLESAQSACDRVFEQASQEGLFVSGTTAYAIPEKEEYWTVPVLQGFERFFTSEELGNGDILTAERKGRQVIDAIMKQIETEGMNVADASVYLNRLASVIVMLQAGNLAAAQRRAEEVNTTVVYSQSRKNWLISLISEHL